jgi:tripartite-type tricarboxylate transporter receptor subunit TctC
VKPSAIASPVRCVADASSLCDGFAARRAIGALLLATTSLLLSNAAFPQTYTARPIRVVVPFPAGGSIDIVSRSISQRWSAVIGQQLVIDNRGGAGGTLGTQLVAQAPADGHTILYANSGPISIGPHLYTKLGYDVFRDFAPVSQTTSAPYVIFAAASLPVSTPQQLIAYAKERPGQLNYASSGVGSGLHLTGELFKNVAGIDLTHVPFKGMGQAAPELTSGRVHLAVSTVPGVLPHVKAGRMKGIVSSGTRRSPALPEVPTCNEAGLPTFCSVAWHAVLAPARTPKAVVSRLHETLAQTLSTVDLREQLLARDDADAIGSTPDALAKLMKSEFAQYGRIIKTVGIRAE